MDEYTRDFYSLLFENKFLKAEGDAFQDLFASIMEAAHTGDFVRTRPWGRRGDAKNDGWQASTATVFQCYGPQAIGSSQTVAKMEEDFEGAVTEWTTMRNWVFVHNSARGLPPDPLSKAIELGNRYDHIQVEIWGFAELLEVVQRLAEGDLRRLFGAVPQRTEVADARFGELLPVLEAVAIGLESATFELRVPPIDKIERNGLSGHVARLLHVGTEGSEQVEAALRESADATLGDQVAAAFTLRYQQLRGDDRTPDEIFLELQEFAGWSGADTGRQGAILAVLSYLFERCDIFEAS